MLLGRSGISLSYFVYLCSIAILRCLVIPKGVYGDAAQGNTGKEKTRYNALANA